MYQPPQFRSTDRALAARLMREHPFASLISNDDTGLPFVTHLPLHLEDRGDAFVLLGHCARPNPHWRYLEARPTAGAALAKTLRTRCWRGIMAFELKVVDLQCKLKLNQHRPESHAALKAGYAQGNEQERELGRWMDSLDIGEQEK